ncbi:DNA mismatch repair protein Msh2, partial [Nephila pilipes]
GELLHYVSMTKGHFIQVLRHLLFVIQYKVKILRNFGSGKSNNWKTVGEASPGNLAAVEDLLFDDNSYAMPQRGLVAV